MAQSLEHVRDVKRQYAAELLQHPEVTSVGVGELDSGEPCIVIGVRSGASNATDLPTVLQDVPVRIDVSGEFRPL